LEGLVDTATMLHNMIESCRKCDGIICQQVQKDVYMKKDKLNPPEIIIGKIAECPKADGKSHEWDDIDSWFELEYPQDNLHLGS